jgi:hypothetical protein
MTNRSPQPDWVLIRRIVRYVNSAPGGGLHRRELAERTGLPAWGPVMRNALLVAWSRKSVDFCGDWVVMPAHKAARA